MNVGDRVGDYEIIGILGAGGMGQVYKVRNTLSERIEAMKVLLPNLESDQELADRFLREIKVQAALDHPNIAKLNTAFRSGNQLVMILELVEGQSIEAVLLKQTIPVRDSVGYTQQVLDALAYAHARGVTHRDIKPANIMITPAGVIKLMDFGIARIKTDRRLTQTGHTVGSLFYMSPEQIRGGEPDGRSDLYALGVTLYEMVTGRRPFSGESDFSIMAAHLQSVPRPAVEIVPGVPPGLSEVISMALAKEPEQRFQTAEAMRAALSNVAAGNPGPPAYAAPVYTAPAATQPAHTVPTALPPPLAFADQSAAQAPPPLPYTPAPTVPHYAGTPNYAGSLNYAGAPAPQKSRRGLYMALGSLATVLVLVGAAFELPRYMRARGSDQGSAAASPVSPAASPSQPQNPAQPQNPPPAVTPSQPADTPPQQPAPSQPAPSSPAPSAAANPVPRPPEGRTVVTRVAPPEARASRRPPEAAQQPNPAAQQPTPAAEQPPQPAVQPPPQQAVQQPAPASGDIAELREKRNDLAIRAQTAREGLASIRQQMARSGLGLRGDISEAETRMNFQMTAANEALRMGDPENARRHLEMAGYAISTIEKFLGR